VDRKSDNVVNEGGIDAVIYYIIGIVLLFNLLPNKIVCGRHVIYRPFLSITVNGPPSVSMRFKRTSPQSGTSTRRSSSTPNELHLGE
jgi:hypothetical protein